MELYRYDLGYSLDALRRDAQRAVEGWDWSRSAHGHVLSLPEARHIHPAGRYRYPNFPYSGRLERCSYFREIFESFPSPKMSFRLLRRGPQSSYALHHDRWAGSHSARFQIPIFTDPEARLVLTSFESVEEIPGALRSLLEQADFAGAAAAAPAHVRLHPLDAGVLYLFDTRRVHTLFNPGATERLVLSFDLIVDDWLREQFADVSAPIARRSSTRVVGPRAALARDYCLSALHPWRNRMQRLRGSHR